MYNKLLELLEEGLRNLYKKGLSHQKKEEYVLIKMNLIGVIRMFFRVIFYFLLIMSGYLLTTLMTVIKSLKVYFEFVFFVIITIVIYEGLDHFF